MKKPDSLRAALVAALPDLARDPERFLVFIDKGSLHATYVPGLSFECAYTLNIILTDFAEDPLIVWVALLAWLSANQPELLDNVDLRREGVSFEADITTVGGCLIRFAGAYQSDDTGAVDAVEVVVRGRHKELDFGSAKPGDNTQHKFTTPCSYYKLSINGAVKIEIDLLNMLFLVDGVDRLAEQRRALGI
ncbi:phage tail protein [Dyella sp. 2RAB6]|uniref:phage tail protein n=1 Tax=Dyella sp. 2RAB6 TaxID=3232992 RepID=UPI003F8FD515